MSGPLKIVRYLEYLVGAAAGALLWFAAYRNHLGEPPGWYEVFFMAFGGFVLVWQLLKINKALRRDTSRYIVLKSETGSVRVQASAIEEALRHTAKSLPEVHDVRVRLVLDEQTRLPVGGEVDARIKDLTNIVAVHDTLCRVLGERYEQILPGGQPVEFHLTIRHHFRPQSAPKRRREKRVVPPEEDETKAIRAPVYPVPKNSREH